MTMADIQFMLTLVSMLVATAASLLAWRVVSEARSRSEARIAGLAEAVQAQELPDDLPVAMPHLLEPAGPDDSARLLLPGLAVLAAVLAIGGVSWARSTAPGSPATPPIAADATTAPLELVSLSDDRGPGGELELRGAVRNPPNGATLRDVTAVALLFDEQGAFVTSSRAPLEARGISSGSDATFRIRVPHADHVGRYRVSFRMDDQIIPHTDRRDEP